MKFSTLKKGFFDTALVKRHLDAASRAIYSRFGAFVRRAAKSSLRMGRRKKWNEMRADEKRDWSIWNRKSLKAGRTKPPFPRMPSVPRKPPRLRMTPASQNPLRKLIFFAYDPPSQSVVIGPLGWKGHGAELLEYGGRGPKGEVAERPFMRPAFAKELPGLPAMWRDSISR